MAALKTELEAVRDALAVDGSDRLGDGTAPNRAGTDVGVDVYGLIDTALKNERDLYRLIKEIDRVLPTGTAQTDITTVITNHFT